MGLYEYDSTQDKLKLVAGSTNFSDAPIGAIYPFGGSVIPTSFLLCDGSAISRTDYAELFAVIGTAFGAGDGSTTFNIPDLRESVPKGAGLTGKTVGAHLDADGLAVGEFLDDRVQAHTHSNKTGSTTAGSVAWTMYATNQLETATEQTNNGVIGRFGVTTEVKSVGVNYIIKAKQVGMPADFASAVGDIVVDKNTYSTSETIVGKWIDGKPIYRKVFTGLYVTANPSSNWVSVVSVPNTDALVSFKAMQGLNTDWTSIVLGQLDNGVFKLYNFSGLNFTVNNMIIEYTKTT